MPRRRHARDDDHGRPHDNRGGDREDAGHRRRQDGDRRRRDRGDGHRDLAGTGERRRRVRAPSLKKADIGVAMGIKGTEVTKEAAEMVLADDNFASITAAVKEGRTVYNNIEKAMLFMLPTNVAQARVSMAAILMGFTAPITSPQILWVNMVTSVALGLVISFEPHELAVMQRH